MRPGHRPPRDKRYFHTQRKFDTAHRVQLNERIDALAKRRIRQVTKAQVKACRSRPRA